MNASTISTAVKKDFNLNTIAIIVSFLTLFTAIVTTWNSLQYRQAEIEEWQVDHDGLHLKMSEDRTSAITAFTTRLDVQRTDQVENERELDLLKQRASILEKSIESIDIRISRITESYGNQFTEIRGQLGVITTQLALLNDAIKRMDTGRMLSDPN